MKKIELYECEICHTKYNEKQRAQNCEKAHVKALEIKDCIFNNDAKYPFKLLIKFEDGKEIWFRT